MGRILGVASCSSGTIVNVVDPLRLKFLLGSFSGRTPGENAEKCRRDLSEICAEYRQTEPGL